ncbi:Alpha/Beta hydrolase protein [Russula vinacea]|nr:Alpha/Beta hydrolase protein [Russula vinacea]
MVDVVGGCVFVSSWSVNAEFGARVDVTVDRINHISGLCQSPSCQTPRPHLRTLDNQLWLSSLPFLSLRLRNAGPLAGLLVQPTANADPPSGWLVLSTFVGLPIALWAYKCMMLVVFQRYVPPGSRTELLRDVYPEGTPKGIHIEELTIPSSQPNTVRLSTLLLRRRDTTSPPKHVVVYCQGNAGNPLHRIPVFNTLLNAIPSLAILAPAPRSYWTTSGASRPTQAGLIADYTAALAFATSRFPTSRLTIYGHSLGASIALCLLAHPGHKDVSKAATVVHGLVLENAFTSVPDMVRVFTHNAGFPIATSAHSSVTASHLFPRGLARRAMVLVSEQDEVVPPEMGREIFGALRASDDTQEGREGVGSRMREQGRKLLGRFVVVEGALHEDAWRYREWTRAVKQYLEDLQSEPTNPIQYVMEKKWEEQSTPSGK